MYEYEATLVEVHDADTLRLDVDLGFSVHFLTPNPRKDLPQSLRIYGYDGPELDRADHLGETARDAVLAWFSAHPPPYQLRTYKDHRDARGRYLVRSLTAPDGHELIADQIALGWLKPYPGYGPKPVWP